MRQEDEESLDASMENNGLTIVEDDVASIDSEITVLPLREFIYSSPSPTRRMMNTPPAPKKRNATLSSFVEVLEYEHQVLLETRQILTKRNEELEAELYQYRLIRNMQNAAEGSQCPICYENMTRISKLVGKCTHIICLQCYELSQEKKCPVCRTHFLL